MNKYIYLWIAVLGPAFLLQTGCRNDQNASTGSLEIVFQGTFGNDPLYMFERSYPYPDDMQVKWQLFQFYISDLEIDPANSGSSPLSLSQVELIDFGGIQTEAAAREGVKLTFHDLPAGDYQSLSFGLGVAPDLNATQPSDYAISEPLGQVANYWEASSSYIYTKIEGNADLDGDGQFGEQDEKLTFHLGASDLYRQRILPVSLSIREGQTPRVIVKVDLRKALVDSAGQYVDFRQTPKDHHKNPAVYEFVINNLRESAIGLNN